MANNYKVFPSPLSDTIGIGATIIHDVSPFLGVTSLTKIKVVGMGDLLFSIDEGSGFGDDFPISAGQGDETILNVRQIRITNNSGVVSQYVIALQGSQ